MEGCRNSNSPSPSLFHVTWLLLAACPDLPLLRSGPPGSASSQQQGEMEPEAAVVPRRSVGPCLLIVTAHGIGKRVPLGQLRLGTRRQSGVLAIRVASAARARQGRSRSSRNGSGGGAVDAAAVERGADRIVAILPVVDGQEVIMASRNGVVVRQGVDGITVQGRVTRGTFVMQLDEGDEVVDVVEAAPVETSVTKKSAAAAE